MKRIGPYSKASAVRAVDVIGRLIYEGRIASIVEFCEKTGIPKASIHRWKVGVQFPTIEDVGTMHKAFGINPTWLITGSGAMYGVRDIGSELNEILKELQKMAAEAKKLRQK